MLNLELDSPALSNYAVGLEEANSEIVGRYTYETGSVNSNSDSVDSERSLDFEPVTDFDFAATACNQRSELESLKTDLAEA